MVKAMVKEMGRLFGNSILLGCAITTISWVLPNIVNWSSEPIELPDENDTINKF